MQPPPEPGAGEAILLGRVSGLFGIKGWLKVFSDTDPRENIVAYRHWFLSHQDTPVGPWRPIQVLEGRRQGKSIIARLDGVDTPEQAQALIGRHIAVHRQQLPESGEEGYYWADLVGCEVLDLQGRLLGKVDRLFETGANDVMVVAQSFGDRDKTRAGGREFLVPWVRPSVITKIDLPSHQIKIDWDPDF